MKRYKETLKSFWNDKRGFELVELLVVIVIMVALMAAMLSAIGTVINKAKSHAEGAPTSTSSAYSEAPASSETNKEEKPTQQQPPTVIKQDVTELHFDFKAKDVIIAFAVIAAFFVGKAIIKAASVGALLSDYFDDKKHRGAYAYNFEGAGGMLKMGYKEFRTLFAENPGRYCVLHDDKRKIVQLILFNPTALFPYKMYFDYNSAYGKGEYRVDRHFVNCSYVQLSRHDRKKLAASLRRSRFDSDGVRFGTNELSSCGCMMQDADNAVIEAKNTCAQEMEKQKTIIANIAASAPAKQPPTKTA